MTLLFMDNLTFFYEIVTKSELKRKKYFMGQNSITFKSNYVPFEPKCVNLKSTYTF